MNDAALIDFVRANATTPTTSTAGSKVTEAFAGVDEPAPSLSSLDGLSAAAVGIGRPQDADVTSRLNAGNFFVRENFDVGGTSDVFGLVMLGGELPDDATGLDIVLDAEVDFEIDLSQISFQQDLLVGVLDPIFDGTSGTSVVFEVLVEGVVAVSETFTDQAGANSALDDTTFNLGDLASIDLGTNNLLDILVTLEVTTSNPGDGFRTDLIFGNSTLGSGPPIPEPSTALLIVLGLMLLSVGRPTRLLASRASR